MFQYFYQCNTNNIQLYSIQSFSIKLNSRTKFSKNYLNFLILESIAQKLLPFLALPTKFCLKEMFL